MPRRVLGRVSLTVAAGLLSAGTAAGAMVVYAAPRATLESPEQRPEALQTDDEELRIGRYWHARERILGLGGAAALAPADRLALAEAEAGLGNWAQVSELLADAEWTDRLDGARGAFLYARALEEADREDAAIDAYARFEALAGLGSRDLLSARMRRARLLAAHGDMEPVLDELASLEREESGLASWVALEIAEDRAREGDVEAVRALFPRIADPAAESRKWELLARAYQERDDQSGALEAYLEVLPWMDDGPGRARVWSAIGSIREQQNRPEDAKDAYLNALGATESGSGLVAASLGLVKLGVDDAPTALRVARVLSGAGHREPALEAYQTFARFAGSEEGESERLARGRLALQTRNLNDAASALEPLTRSANADIGATALDLLHDVRTRQGRRSDAERLQDEILSRYPSSAEAAEILFFQADALHDEGAFTRAAEGYRRAYEANASSSRGGLSAMRLGQLHLARGDHAGAAQVFEDFLERADYDGPYADEALYWAARSRLDLGDSERATTWLTRVRDRSPVTYYAVQTADLLDQPFTVPVPSTPTPPPAPWIVRAVDMLRLLDENDFNRAESALAERYVERARPQPVSLLHLAAGFHLLNRNWQAIQLGWDVRNAGRAWDRQLLEVIYPFPYREMVLREAEEVGVDPFLMAAVIRQESAFLSNARSSANARGLMQVLPVTGRELARRIGPSDFDAGKLYVPDINLHLGATYLKNMLERYDHDLPLVLSAYNAGPTRANRWRNFPEASDPVRFTERIPFRETRGYVKAITRNQRMYAHLYGGDASRDAALGDRSQ